ncbi:hypothetical protein E3N88_00392 [Mikania micrantha]|uniref:NAD(P)H dehydrogenase subunit J n=1 Tax=Mikania micrantha TaxID=192012 RepID=A0A5N6PZP5_9ASTR|nr:hypothetical protein E3N88_00392 [Mikania micrantha]
MQGNLSAWLVKHALIHRSLGFDYQGIEALQIKPPDWHSIAVILYVYGYNYLRSQCAYDVAPGGLLASVYHLTRIEYGVDQPEEVCIKVFAPKRDPRIPSVFWVWKSVDFQERESYDMLGISYDNHPCLKQCSQTLSHFGELLTKSTPTFSKAHQNEKVLNKCLQFRINYFNFCWIIQKDTTDQLLSSDTTLLDDKLVEKMRLQSQHDQTQAADTDKATLSDSSAVYVFERHERVPVNQDERDMMKEAQASEESNPTEDKDEYYVHSPKHAPKKKLKMASRMIDKGRSPMGTSSSYTPEYVPIDLDLLQARVFALKKDSTKKDLHIEHLRSGIMLEVEKVKGLENDIRYLLSKNVAMTKELAALMTMMMMMLEIIRKMIMIRVKTIKEMHLQEIIPMSLKINCLKSFLST